MPTDVQAVLFDKRYYTPERAVAWVRKHDYKPLKKVHTTDQYHRVRLKQPRDDVKYRTKAVSKSIKFIIEVKPRNQNKKKCNVCK
jgi:hypothetical protein